MILPSTLLSNTVGIAIFGLICGFVVGSAITVLLWRRRAVKQSPLQFTTRFMYSGNLKQTALLDAIQFLELGRREGILHIYVGRRKGYITFSVGEIVDAFFRNTTGREAIFLMLELTYGDFYFESKTVNQPRVITESIMDIALEWDARRYGDQMDVKIQDGPDAADAYSNRPMPADDILDIVHEAPKTVSVEPPPAARPRHGLDARPDRFPGAPFNKRKGGS